MIYAENVLICIAVPLIISLLFIRGGARRFVLSFLAGMVACLLAAYVGGFIENASGMKAEDTSVFISPIIEEVMKLIPVLLCLMLFEPADDKLISFSVGIGAGFATFENCCYVPSSRCTSASDDIVDGYIHWGKAVSESWTIPQTVGAMALCLQNHPKLSYESFVALAKKCNRKNGFIILDINSIIEAIK